nr:spore coat U domain-containing protein [Halomonas endophytica]
MQGIVQVSLDIDRGCLLSSVAERGDMLRPARLDFGRYPRLDPAGGPLSAQLVNDDTPSLPLASLECNPEVEYQLQVDGGQNAGSGDKRYLRLTADDTVIPYRLFIDAARRQPLDTAPISRRAGTGQTELSLYASVVPQASVPKAGRYQDTLRMTLTW